MSDHSMKKRADEYVRRLNEENEDTPPVVWTGGDCPLDDGTNITVTHRSGFQYRGVLPFMEATYWVHGPVAEDINVRRGEIIAYQIHGYGEKP